MKNAVALIDGEHYPPVIKHAIQEISKREELNFTAGLLLGGTEKIKSREDLEQIGIPVFPLQDLREDLRRYLSELKPEIVIDLSDEPVIGYKERFMIASVVLQEGMVYKGADFVFTPPTFHDVIGDKPSATILGTGKRIGKTAISSAVSKTLKSVGFNPVVVAMGRGGPPEPELLHGDSEPLDAETLLRYSDAGRHAASDHFENALMSRVTSIGCRRCGGGLAGETYVSNVLEGAQLAAGLKNDFILFDGSGAAIPPIKTQMKLLVLSAAQPLEYFESYMGPYRIRLADVAIITMAEEPLADDRKITAVETILREINPDLELITTYFRTAPVTADDFSGKTAVLATTAPAVMGDKIKSYLEEQQGVTVTGISFALSNRPRLHEDLTSFTGGKKPDVIFVELKAAAIDVVVNFARDQGIRIAFVNNIPVNRDGTDFYKQLGSIFKSRFR